MCGQTRTQKSARAAVCVRTKSLFASSVASSLFPTPLFLSLLPHLSLMSSVTSLPPPPPTLQSSNVYNTLLNNNELYNNANNGGEEISTIFVVGFPDDMQEREFQNMFIFSPGFEAATLKIPSKDAEDDATSNSNGNNSARRQIVSRIMIFSGRAHTHAHRSPSTQTDWLCEIPHSSRGT